MLAIDQLLNQKGLRASPQRIAIFDYLVKNKNHPTVDTIYKALHPDIPSLSKTTVYNTLKKMVESDLVMTVTIEDSEARYDADTSNHGHFKCSKCDVVYDVFFENDEEKKFSSSLPEGFTADKQHIYYWGICSECN